jgi:hypothetical protein
MSELTIGLVAEGSTDFVIIEAALKACLERPFVLTLLQPELTRPEMQGGWGGVYKWCRSVAARGFGSPELDPTLSRFDLLIIHVDADVAEDSYSDIGPEVPTDVAPLPCAKPCPPPEATVDTLRAVVLSWLGVRELGPKTMLCIPSKATEAWLAVAAASDLPRIMADLECALTMEARLSSLPKERRIRKTKPQYQGYAAIVQAQWPRIATLCTQARQFQDELAILVTS